jgi:hypothetical protein
LELKSKGNGQVARNATKHPKIIALLKLNYEKRASISAAAAQGLAWMQECSAWCRETTLRNQIALRVMAGVLVGVGRIKKGYSSAQLGALLRIGASLKDNDNFILRARGAIAEILAGSFGILPSDVKTLALMKQFLDVIAAGPNAASVFKAMEKLASLTGEDHLAQLRQAASRWR